MLALIYCLAISVLYVVSLYVWRGVPPDRQHPDTVKARMLGVLLTCCVAWLPTWHMRNQLASQRQSGSSTVPGALPTTPTDPGQQPQEELPGLLSLLGLSCHGRQLAAALAKATGLTLLMFLGPLCHTARQWLSLQQQKQQQHQQWRPQTVLGRTALHQARDYLVSPIAEEFCFRACMAPLLWMQGFSRAALILVPPLFFGTCHLHHGWGMVNTHGLSAQVVAVCLLQFAYTTLFGWYAAWVFLATGSILAAMAVHALCNVMGLPPFQQMDPLSLALCGAGLGLAGALGPSLLGGAGCGSAAWWSQCTCVPEEGVVRC